ncbi:unnamed protein product [Ixodes hexagonus]
MKPVRHFSECVCVRACVWDEWGRGLDVTFVGSSVTIGCQPLEHQPRRYKKSNREVAKGALGRCRNFCIYVIKQSLS